MAKRIPKTILATALLEFFRGMEGFIRLKYSWSDSSGFEIESGGLSALFELIFSSEADILYEGHYGVYGGKKEVANFIGWFMTK